MRGAGRSERWISESLRNLNRLEASAGNHINEVQPEQVSEFLASPTLGAGSRATYFRQINSFYAWWAKQGGRHITAELPRPREPRGEPRPLSSAQVQQLLDTPMHRRTRVMILLALLAGLRVHEIAKVHGEDIDIEAGQLQVTGKGGVMATLPLHPLLISAAATMPKHGYWFPANATRPGQHVLRRSVSHVISLACERAGIMDGTAHRLRHWYATTLLHDGADVRTVQTLLRHASLTTTQRYTLVTDERRRKAISQLEIGALPR
jgi:site-specific recombinase XerD